MKLDNGWSILCGFYSDFLLHLTEQVRLCIWNDKDTTQVTSQNDIDEDRQLKHFQHET